MIGTHTRNIAIFSLVYLVVACAGFAYLFIHTQEMGAHLQEQTAIIANNNILEQRQIELSQLLRQTEVQREELQQYLLTEEKTIDFLSEVERAAGALGVQFITDSLKVTPKEGAFDTLEVQFTFSGNEQSVREMARILETLPYHGQITRLEQSRMEDASRLKSVVQLEITLLKS